MIGKFHVYKENHDRWPAKNGKPGGEAFKLLLMDMTKPPQHALNAICQYRLTDEEKEKHWGQLEGKAVEVAVTDIHSGDKSPLLRGSILSIGQ